MIGVPLKQIDYAVIESLISNGVRESRTLDYKESLPGPTKDDKKEFLADLSAFANAAGGDIIFGISELRENGKPTGKPDRVVGLGSVNLDAEVLRLENMIRDGIEPRINGLQFFPVSGSASGPILVLRVPKSYLAPHMIKAGDSRFYSRNNAGKYPLDVTEIRSAFALSDTLPEKIRRFRDERIARIVAEETPVQLLPYPKTVLHLLPISSLDPTTRVDITTVVNGNPLWQPLSSIPLTRWRTRHNLEGMLATGYCGNPLTSTTYTQLYRNGTVEVVESAMLRSQAERDNKIDPLIRSWEFKSALIAALDRFIRLQASLRIEPPICVMLSLVDVKGYRLAKPVQDIGWISHYQVDRDTLLLPESMVLNFDEYPDKILQPALDSLWQSVGFERDESYDEFGDGRSRFAGGIPSI